MLASGLSAATAMSALTVQRHVVTVDQLRAAKVAENFRDFTALAADNRLGLRVIVSGEPAADLGPVAGPDHDRVATLEAAFDSGHPGRQQALARSQCLHRAIVENHRAFRLER